MADGKVKKPSEGAKQSRPSVSQKQVAKPKPHRTREHLEKGAVDERSSAARKGLRASVPTVVKGVPHIDAGAGSAASAGRDAAKASGAAGSRPKIIVPDFGGNEGPSPVDVIAQARLEIGKQVPPVVEDASEAASAASREGGVSSAAEADSAPAAAPSQQEAAGRKSKRRRARVHLGRKVKTPGKTLRAKWALRIVLIVVAVIVAAALVWFSVFAWNRSAAHDDAADFQGTWFADGTTTLINIDGGSIRLSDDVSYTYTLDTKAKTVSFMLGNMKGQGRYWFNGARDELVIYDGTFSSDDTFKLDLNRALLEAFAPITGADTSIVSGDGVTVLTRCSDQQYAQLQQEKQDQAQAKLDAAKAERYARDADGDGIDDETGAFIYVVDEDGDGVDDETGELIADIDADGDGILDERKVVSKPATSSGSSASSSSASSGQQESTPSQTSTTESSSSSQVNSRDVQFSQSISDLAETDDDYGASNAR